MKPRRPMRELSRREAGYALLTVVFLGALMVIVAVTAAPVILTEGKREKEEELIWRGEQYARAVRLFYRKTGRFPQSLEDLTKKQAEVRFIRKAYKEPMNREDGSWRLIYVAPTGQLIGSVKRRFLGQASGAAGGTASSLAQLFSPSRGSQQAAGEPQPRPAGTPPTPTPPAGSETSATSPSGPEGPILGGNLIGVASKVNKASLKVYEGGTTYREWEFIWDPTKDAVLTGQPGAVGGPAGSGPAGGIVGTPGKQPTPPPPPPQ